MFVTAGQVVSQGLSIAAAMIMARTLSKEVYGTYRQLLLLFSYVSPVALLGLPGSIYYLFGRLEERERAHFVWQILFTVSLIGALVSLSVFWGKGIISGFFNNPALVAVIGAFALYLWSEVLCACIYPFAAAAGLYAHVGLMSVTGGLMSFGVAGASLLQPNHLSTLVVTLTCASLLRLAFAIFPLFFRYPLTRQGWKIGSVRSALAYSVPLAVAGIVSAYSFDFDRLTVGRLYSSDAFAAYAVGAAEFPLIGLLLGSLNTVTTGQYARFHSAGRHEEVAALWSRVAELSALMYMPIFFGLLGFAREVVTILYSSAYLSALPYFIAYQLLIPLRVLTPQAVLIGAGRSRQVLYGHIGFSLVNAAFNLVGVTFFGAVGAACGTVAATLVLFLYFLRESNVALGRPWYVVAPWAYILRVTALAAVSVIPWVLVVRLAGLAAVPTAVVAGLGVPITYLMALKATGTRVPEGLERGLMGRLSAKLRSLMR